MKIRDITGVILSGGKSSRMGMNKALLKIGEITIIEKIAKLLESTFEKVILITNTPEDYEFLGIPIFEDLFKNKGPLAGIHSALKNSTKNKIFVLPCDMPLITKDLIAYIVNYNSEKPIIIYSVGGLLQPLVGVYSKQILKKLEYFLLDNNSNKSFYKFFSFVQPEIIDPQTLPFYKKEDFFNLNEIEDYQMLISKFQNEI